MKELYCKYCGQELEKGACVCGKTFDYGKNDTTGKRIICDTCKKQIDADSKFCTYCGVPVGTDVYERKLIRELRGEFEQDVLADLKIKKNAELQKIYKKVFTPTVVRIIGVIIVVISLLIIVKLISVIKDTIVGNDEKYLEITETIDTSYVPATLETTIAISNIDETLQPVIAIHDNWTRQGGYYYCMDDEGNPIIDDWVKEIDKNGDAKYYYFDIDGRLVVNSWIDGEYYVGSDGAMYKDEPTPDGAYVDENGRVVIDSENVAVAVERETRVYYEAPDTNAVIKSSNQKSSSEGVIKGVDVTKTYELYIKEIKKMKDTYVSGNTKCTITYYYPIIEGGKEKEVNKINELIVEMFTDRFRNVIFGVKDENGKVPKAITLNTVDQRQLNQNRFIFILSGKLVPEKGLTEKKKYRFIYDRKSKKLDMLDISDY